MAETDWELMEGSLDTATVSYGTVTGADAAPPEGVACLGFHSLQPCEGVSALISTVAIQFLAPMPPGRGGTIYSHTRKLIPMHQYAPMIFLACGKNVVSAQAYILGLSEEWPYRIALKKGLLVEGLRADDESILGLSDAVYDTSDWHNLWLQVTVNTQGDTVLHAEKWVAGPNAFIPIPGMDDVIDDALGVLTGTPGLIGPFYPGIGHYNRAAPGRISLFDVTMYGRQTAP